MEDKKYTKLSDLVNGDFTILKVWGFKYKSWDNATSRMISEDQWFEGSRKMYQVDTDKGKLDLSESQLGSLFVKVQRQGKSDVNNLKVIVKSNGKSGLDIRYYLNPDKYQRSGVEPVKQTESEYSIEDIPI